jgi:DNA-binding NarL/FixJ family response regulator
MSRGETRLRVLLVENSSVLVKRMIERIEADAHATVVGIAATAASAIDQLERLRPDALILDVALNAGTGFDVLRALRRQAGGAVPVAVMFSNYSSPPYRDAAKRLGAAHFFDKSDEFVRLIDFVRSLGARHGTRNESEG